MAPPFVKLILLLETAMGVGLLAGAILARFRRFRAHAWCQSVIVLLNVGIIAIAMIPSFWLQVIPKVPQKLDRPYYALATAHAALGTIAELAGLYVLLSAGTRVLPERFRIIRYKLWMRIVLLLWWVVLLLGWATYARWYVPHESRRTSAERYDDTCVVPSPGHPSRRARRPRRQRLGAGRGACSGRADVTARRACSSDDSAQPFRWKSRAANPRRPRAPTTAGGASGR